MKEGSVYTYKLILLRFLKKYFALSDIIRTLNYYIRCLAYQTHKLQYKIEWSIDNPEHFDHFMDLNYQWRKNKASFPMERGVFSSFALQTNQQGKGKTLDLCCGDGFYTNYFYALNSKEIVGIDFDEFAIKWANKNYKDSGIKFILGDIRKDIPEGPFDNVVWDAAIEHFTEEEILNLMSRIKNVLAPNGILSGYTIKEPEHHGKHLHQHEYEFHNKEDLIRFLSPFFKNVQVIETIYPSRVNYYFYASDSVLPFDSENVMTHRK
jgi:SAM-dependent methyltransferase